MMLNAESFMYQTKATAHKAKKRAHRCSWCWQFINIGDTYKRYRYYSSGDAGTCKLHPGCYSLMLEVASLEGGMIEWIPGQERPCMKVFETFEKVDDMLSCMKKPIVVQCKQISEDFRVNTLEGNYKQGKSGDYLIKGVDGELYICDKDIFERTYSIL